MQLIKDNVKEIIFCIAELVIGILLLIDPVQFTSGIIILAGVGLISSGIHNIFKYFRLDAEEAKKGQLLTVGLIVILAGLFFSLRFDWFVATFPILTVIYGVSMLVTGISKVQLMVDLLRLKNKKWILAGVNALISIICAVVILSSPFTSTVILWIFTGVSLIVEAIFDVVVIVIGYMENRGYGN